MSASIDLKRHIARTAAELFFAEGIARVGVDRIADRASVAKRTLYRHYRSKDALVAAALREADIVRFPTSGNAGEQIVGAFSALAEYLAETRYRGCPYIFYNAELVDRAHPARSVIERRVQRRLAWFVDRCRELGVADARALAEQLDVLFDGALASGAKRADCTPAHAALEAARLLLAAHGVR